MIFLLYENQSWFDTSDFIRFIPAVTFHPKLHTSPGLCFKSQSDTSGACRSSVTEAVTPAATDQTGVISGCKHADSWGTPVQVGSSSSQTVQTWLLVTDPHHGESFPQWVTAWKKHVFVQTLFMLLNYFTKMLKSFSVQNINQYVPIFKLRFPRKHLAQVRSWWGVVSMCCMHTDVVWDQF